MSRLTACDGAPGCVRRFASYVGTVALTALALHPVFFIIFRLMIFNTLPRDDYAPYLLWLLGEPGGAAPGSPYGYRILSVFGAAPFYYGLPSFSLTNIPGDLSLAYVKATAALAALSFVSLVMAAVLAYRLVVDRHGLGRIEGAVAAAFILLAGFYSAIYALDSVTIVLVVAALYVIDRPLWFAVVLIASVVFNEKVAMLFAIWLGIRCILRRADWPVLGPQLIAACVALTCFVLIIAIVRLPGHGEQLDHLAYLPTLMQNLAASLTPRGFALNILPCALLVILVAWSWRVLGTPNDAIYRPLDLLIIPAMALVALVLTQYFQTGRIVAHAAPLFALPVAHAAGLWLRRAP